MEQSLATEALLLIVSRSKTWGSLRSSQAGWALSTGSLAACLMPTTPWSFWPFPPRQCWQLFHALALGLVPRVPVPEPKCRVLGGSCPSGLYVS